MVVSTRNSSPIPAVVVKGGCDRGVAKGGCELSCESGEPHWKSYAPRDKFCSLHNIAKFYIGDHSVSLESHSANNHRHFRLERTPEIMLKDEAFFVKSQMSFPCR